MTNDKSVLLFRYFKLVLQFKYKQRMQLLSIRGFVLTLEFSQHAYSLIFVF